MTAIASHLLIEHIPQIRRWLRRRTRDSHLIDDIIQETMVQALIRLPELRDSEKLGGWLHRIAERRWIDAHRRPLSPELPLVVDPAVPEPVRMERHRHAGVYAAVRELPRSLRRAVRLHYLHGIPVPEVAIMLDTTVGGVKSRLYRARRLMRGESAV